MAQVWARQDTFDAGGTHYGSRLTQWIGCRPIIDWAYGRLCDFDNDGAPYPHGVGGIADKPCGFLWRVYQPEDVAVEIQAYLRENAPANIPSSPWLSAIGVFARVTGGTLTVDATPAVHYADCNGYAFILEANPQLIFAQFSLNRFVGGVRTVLSSFAYPLGSIPTDFEQPVGMKLTCTTVAGNVVLVGTISNIVVGGVAYNNLTIVTATDSSGSKITGTGRAGILLGQDRQVTLAPGFDVRLREKVASFTTYNPSTNAVLMREEFIRTNKAAGFLDTDDWGNAGRSVQGGFYHDIQSATATAGKIIRDTSPADGIEFEAAGLGDPNRKIWACISQRPADDTRKQNPKLVGRWESAGSDGSVTIRQLGLIARASQLTPASDAAGLSAYVAYLDKRGATWTAKLLRYLNGSVLELASASISALLEDTDYTLELAVRDQPGTGLGGPAEMELARDGNRISLVATTTVPGVFNSSTGIIVDGTADRITQGPGEGIWQSTNDTTKLCSVTTWDQGTIVPSVTPWVDLDSATVADEGTASGSLNTVARVVFPFGPATVHNTQATRSDAGYLYTQARASRGFRNYGRLETEPMTQTQRDAFLVFWHSKEGGAAFNFTDPMDGLTRSVRFLPDSYEEQQPFRGVFILGFGLEELA